MRIDKKSHLILIAILLFVLLSSIFLLTKDSSSKNLSEERQIYVGDLVYIEIPKETVTEMDIREAFNEFEIISIEEKEKEYIIAIRSFEIGVKTVMIQGQEINIHINSLLADSTREDIYEGNYNLKEPGINIYWKYIEAGLIGLFLISIFMFIYKKYKKTNVKTISNYNQVIDWMTKLEKDRSQYFVKLTAYLKWYIEKTFNIKIIGKTSKEFIEEMNKNNINLVSEKLVKDWLEKCDFHKFSGQIANDEDKEEMKNKLIEIIKAIEENKDLEKELNMKKSKEVVGC